MSQSWIINFKKLKRYKENHGDFNVPQNWKRDPLLARWVSNIRLHPEKLSKDQLRKLNDIGFDFRRNMNWDDMFTQLKAFYKKHKHSYVPPFQGEYEQLFDWTERQRVSRSLLSKAQIQRLESVSFDWLEPKDKDLLWLTRYKQLLDFKSRHRHTRVPSTYENYALARWVSRQREMEFKMPSWRRLLLNDISFCWRRDMEALDEKAWNNKYEALKSFVHRHGHFKIPSANKRFHSLRIWMDVQRQRELSLPKHRKKLLGDIGFPWSEDIQSEKESNWQSMYKELVTYRKIHGDALVSSHSKKYPKLASWVTRQRQNWDSLDKSKRRLLKKIDFKTSADIEKDERDAWLKMFRALKQFKAIHDNCRVPNVYPKNLALGRWVEVQRLNEDKLLKWKKKLLNSIGFSWSDDLARINEDRWYTMYQKLNRFYKRYGHSAVPNGWAKNKQLANWVWYQRGPKEPLTKEKKALLKKLSFEFKARKSKSRRRNSVGQFATEV